MQSPKRTPLSVRVPSPLFPPTMPRRLKISSLLTQRSYEIYTKDAVFHDPIGISRGVDSIRAQFDALTKVCVPVTRDYSRPLPAPEN